MMLPRKRQRPNPTESSSPAPATPPQTSTTSLPSSAPAPNLADDNQPVPHPEPSGVNDLSGGTTNTSSKLSVRKTQSWYGSWPRTPKASASTSVARENILAGSVKLGKAPDLSRFDMKKDSDARSIHSTARSATGLSAVPENRTDSAGQKADDNGTSSNETTEENGKPPATEGSKADDLPSSDNPEPNTTRPERPATASGWLGWLSKTPFLETQSSSTPQPPPSEERKPAEAPRPSTPVEQTAPPETVTSETPSETPQDPPRPTSWFGFWSSSTPNNDKPNANENSERAADSAQESQDVVMSDAPPPPPPPPQKKKHEPAPKAGSTWAFWSSESPKAKGSVPDQDEGQIAVIGEGSETHPKPMTEDDVSPSKRDAQVSGKSTWRRGNKRNRPQSVDIDSQSSPSGTSTPQDKVTAQTPGKPDTSSKVTAEIETARKEQQNLLLPSFSSTYQMKQDPSILKQIAQLVLRTQQGPVNHVLRIKDPPRVRKAIAIGIHGLFPATYLRPMIGQPTGTSLRFASLCADAIRRWADQHGSPDCCIEKVALEGEGKINERVDNLWKLMLNWIEQLRHADLIIIACHSQGVPVSIMLLEKLIDLGIITDAKIGVCAMAGVSLGPFPEYKSGILMGSAAELWDFGNPESVNAQRYEAALKRVLGYGARITFIGSIDDQLVPMESAVYSPANHPYIYRAVFIDGRVHAPDFIAHLIGFALKLRNLGVSDHGLIRELSVALAGSLYSGEGHSRLYYDDQVYDLAVSHALETTSAPSGRHPACEIHHRGRGGAVPGSQQQQGQQNPYVLPWIMRGLLEEDIVKTELSHETEELLRQFDDWKPSNKALRDVKYRLEAVRSKL